MHRVQSEGDQLKMGLYNFKKRFVPAILAETKTHTIRAERKHRDKPGDWMHLYTGLRQKGAQLLMRRQCVKVEQIVINESGNIVIDGEMLTQSEMDLLARRDGFESHADMMSFWEGRLPFTGHVYHWHTEKGIL
jgi:uncharacterized protein YqfB (UPF0267 family)